MVSAPINGTKASQTTKSLWFHLKSSLKSKQIPAGSECIFCIALTFTAKWKQKFAPSQNNRLGKQDQQVLWRRSWHQHMGSSWCQPNPVQCDVLIWSSTVLGVCGCGWTHTGLWTSRNKTILFSADEWKQKTLITFWLVTSSLTSQPAPYTPP